VRVRCIVLRPITTLMVLMLLGSGAQAVETIRLYAGFAIVRRLDRPIGTVVVGNPDVADATVQSENRVVITAKKRTGSTNVIILDNENNEFFNAQIDVIDPEELLGFRPVRINNRAEPGRTGLHDYFAYDCSYRKCERRNDPLENITRPTAAPLIQQSIAPSQTNEAAPQTNENPPQTNTAPQ
jgi:Pilus formation protein N terminal region